MKKVEIFVNNVAVKVPQKSTVLEACESVGIIIPRFCYHHRLNIAGNCRICLVEIEKSPKPQASCAFPVMEQIRVYTNTPLVKKAREAVVEFLLLNHPLDCPICDQGGECDLQDQTFVFGSDRSRFYEKKRGVEDKFLGPFIKTIITRCIHCTRCVRFAEEIAGVSSLGTTIRGRHTEIGTYVNKSFQSEVSANVVDLCPVGALTSKTYAFQARPWELQSVESIDTSDGIGSNIRVDRKALQVVRVLPRRNDQINEDWITDKARFCYDGLYRERLNALYFQKEKVSSWQKSANLLSKLFFYDGKFICGSKIDLETIISLKNISRKLGWDIIGEENKGPHPFTPLFYQSSSSLTQIEKADLCFIIGTNPQKEGWAVNHRLHRSFRNHRLKIKTFGNPGDLNYNTQNIGLSPVYLQKWSEGKISSIGSYFPIFIYGNSLYIREDSGSIHTLARNLVFKISKPKWNGLISLGNRANTTGIKAIGFSNISFYNSEKTDLTYFVGNEDSKLLTSITSKWKIYQGAHGDNSVAELDLLIPSSTSFEKTATYMNSQGKIQKTQALELLNTKWRTDWSIIQWVEDLFKISSEFNNSKILPENFNQSILIDLNWRKPSKIKKTVLQTYVKDVFRTDRLSKASVFLTKASIINRRQYWNFIL